MASPPTPHRSFWLQEIAGDAPDASPLEGTLRTDVAIVGGGYVGLWTAIRLKEMEPALGVVVLEQDVCGGGASGRNGGFVLSWWPKLASLAHRFGDRTAVEIAGASERTIGELDQFCRQHDVDADFRRGGWLWTATAPAHLGAWAGVLRVCDRVGVAPFRRLEPGVAAQLAGSGAHLDGVLETSAAIVQPAALARGLRRVAQALGVRLFEGTRVRSFSRTRPVRIRSGRGVVTADRMVIAANAWAAGIRELAGGIAVISSDIVATEPIPGLLDSIGWHRDLAITDSQTMVDYYRISNDGRVVFGKGGWTIGYGGRIGPRFDRHPRRAALVTSDLRRYYPALASARVTHDWSGPIDRTSDSLPLLGTFPRAPQIAYGIGWSGNGVGPSAIGGRILASLTLGRQDEWSNHPLVGASIRGFPPAPIRFIGGHLVRAAVVRKERAEALGRPVSRLAAALARLAPAGLEDK
jgi:glycine/D-amino acid oxidase-like deaminating enzyme